ncbi:MAG: YbdK family carboxylate-amine ligase [Solirubrobacterales bacterium]
MAEESPLDLGAAREVFEESQDFTIGIEEEFSILDPETLDLVDRFEDFRRAAEGDPDLEGSLAGELIASEVEVRSGRAVEMAEATALQERRRAALFSLAGELGVRLGSSGTHPWADYLDQEIIDTPHYQRLKHDLGWVAQRNNTWSLHVHVGIKGADRAIAVCDRLREELPLLLAVSANSPFLDGRDTGLASVRTEIFTRTFPRCGIPGTFGDWSTYADFVGTLERVGSVVEATQLWWSVRPHHSFGSVEIRICDAQTTARQSTALAGLMVATVAQTALDLDSGRLDDTEPLLDREIEENLWRAIRFGLEGRMVDFRQGQEVETRQALDDLLARTAEARDGLGIEIEPPEVDGATSSRQLLADGLDLRQAFGEQVEETWATFGHGAAEAG